MSTGYGPRIVTDGLVLYLDAGNNKSYPGSGNTWYDISENGNNGTLVNGVGYNSSNKGSLVFDGVNDYIQTSLTGTFPEITFDYWGFFDDPTLSTTSRSESAFGDWTSSRVHWGTRWGGAVGMHWNVNNSWVTVPTTNLKYGWNHFSLIWNHNTSQKLIYINNILSSSEATNGNMVLGDFRVGVATNLGAYYRGNISNFRVYSRSLLRNEVSQNFSALKGRLIPDGSQQKPFNSPAQAQSLGYSDGSYYFSTGSMTSSRLLEFKNNYYENKSWVCVFRSPYNSTATTNELGLNIPMRGLLVQRDSLDIRGAVYWSSPITYNAVGGGGNNTADSGYSPRRVILGFAGGHGIYTTGQNQCSWSNGLGAIGAGWNGSTCGSFPNGLLWGTGQANTATYANASGVWSHWVYWE